MSPSHTEGHGFAPLPGHTKDHKNETNSLPAYYNGLINHKITILLDF